MLTDGYQERAASRTVPGPTAAVTIAHDLPAILRYTAFTDTPEGGNPAGVVLDASALSDAEMQQIAADLGYSESAFVTARADGEYDVRYFSPAMEVPFCGHATIATGGRARRARRRRHAHVPHAGGRDPDRDPGRERRGHRHAHERRAPRRGRARERSSTTALEALGWSTDELDPELPPKVSYAGARHLILAATTRARLADLDYDFDALKAIMLEHELITVDLVYREDETTFHARNPFPVGGVVEDPATGAAAAAFGAYLRRPGTDHAARDDHRPPGRRHGPPEPADRSRSPAERPEIRVSGRAVAM